MSNRDYIVLSPIPTILNEMFQEFSKREPDWTFMFDPSLTYTDAVRGVRAFQTFRNCTSSFINTHSLSPSKTACRIFLLVGI